MPRIPKKVKVALAIFLLLLTVDADAKRCYFLILVLYNSNLLENALRKFENLNVYTSRFHNTTFPISRTS